MKPLRSKAVEQNTLFSPLRILAAADSRRCGWRHGVFARHHSTRKYRLASEAAPQIALAPQMDSAPPRIKALLDEVWSLEQSAMDSQDKALAAAIYCEAARYGNPEDNIRGGLAYLRWLHRRFSGDLSKVVAAYNAGEGAADRHGGKDAGLI